MLINHFRNSMKRLVWFSHVCHGPAMNPSFQEMPSYIQVLFSQRASSIFEISCWALFCGRRRDLLDLLVFKEGPFHLCLVALLSFFPPLLQRHVHRAHCLFGMKWTQAQLKWSRWSEKTCFQSSLIEVGVEMYFDRTHSAIGFLSTEHWNRSRLSWVLTGEFVRCITWFMSILCQESQVRPFSVGNFLKYQPLNCSKDLALVVKNWTVDKSLRSRWWAQPCFTPKYSMRVRAFVSCDTWRFAVVQLEKVEILILVMWTFQALVQGGFHGVI